MNKYDELIEQAKNHDHSLTFYPAFTEFCDAVAGALTELKPKPIDDAEVREALKKLRVYWDGFGKTHAIESPEADLIERLARQQQHQANALQLAQEGAATQQAEIERLNTQMTEWRQLHELQSGNHSCLTILQQREELQATIDKFRIFFFSRAKVCGDKDCIGYLVKWESASQRRCDTCSTVHELLNDQQFATKPEYHNPANDMPTPVIVSAGNVEGE